MQTNNPRIAVGYHVYRSTDPNRPKDQWERITKQPIPDTQFEDDTCLPNIHYYYYVTAVNSAGRESKPSAIVSALIDATIN